MRFEDLFCESLLAIQDKIYYPVVNTVYPDGEIEYVYNNYGYRTHHIPDTVTTPHWLVVGCSHSEGVGVQHEHVYSTILEKTTGITVFNLGQSGGNNVTTELNIFKWIDNIGRPEQVLAQWPSPYRKLLWDDNGTFPEYAERITADNDNPVYNLIAKHSIKNFLYDQIRSIIVVNKFCQAHNIKILNFMLGAQEPIKNLLDKNHINLYDNQKGQWLLDKKAADRSHHSETCHRQWANRIMDLIE
jgi:hypothetical protein